MILGILGKLGLVLLGAIVGIFIYRNNTELISSKADVVDKVWDKLDIDEKIKEAREKLEELLKEKDGN